MSISSRSKRPTIARVLVLGALAGLFGCSSDSDTDPISPPPPLPDEALRIAEEWDGLWAINGTPTARGLDVIPPTFLIMVGGDDAAGALGRLGEAVVPRDIVRTEEPAVTGTWDATRVSVTLLEVGLVGSCAITRTVTAVLSRDATGLTGHVAVTDLIDESTTRGCASEVSRVAELDGIFVRPAPQAACEDVVTPIPAAWAGLWTAENFTPFPSPCRTSDLPRGSVLRLCEEDDAVEAVFDGLREDFDQVCAEVTDTIIDVTTIRRIDENESTLQRARLDRGELEGTIARWTVLQGGNAPLCEGQSFDIRLVDADCLAFPQP